MDSFDDYGVRRGLLARPAPVTEEFSPKLKAIAGMIKDLSYRDMQALGEAVAGSLLNDGSDAVIPALLNFSDRALLK